MAESGASGGRGPATAAGIVSAVLATAVSTTVGGLFGGGWGALVLGLVGLALGAVYGWAVAVGRTYDLGSPKGVLAFVVDHTWSLPNTQLGALWLAGNLAFGNRIDPAFQHRNHVGLVRGPIRLRGVSYATTIGTVYAGTEVNVHDHEAIHVMQARLLGPLYVPLVLTNYVIATILPYWLLISKVTATRPFGRKEIHGFGDYFQWGVYRWVWNEAWAYRVAR